MKNKKTLTIAVFVAFVTIVTVATLRRPIQVTAQDQQPPPVPDRISFGMVGITSGQTVRVSVANTIMPNDINLPPGPVRVLINFRYVNGNLVRDNRTGEVIRKTVDIERGDASFVDLDYSDLPPGPIRAQIRPVVVALPPGPTSETQNAYPRDAIIPTVEIINNANGRSQFAVFTHPGVARGFNPQPDPPAEP